MSAKRPPMKPVDYLTFLLAVVEILTSAGVTETQLSRYELDMMNDSAERGELPTDFAHWLTASRAEPRFGPNVTDDDTDVLTQDGAEEGVMANYLRKSA